MELKQLRAFVEVAEQLHFGLAAEHLHLTQSQVSRRISQLEESLDLQLLERSSRVVKLTDVGQAFLSEAVSVLAAAENAKQRAFSRARGRRGTLRISANDAAMIGNLNPVLRAFYRKYPDVHFAFQAGVDDSLGRIELLTNDLVDVVFCHPPAARYIANLERIDIVRDPLIAVLPGHHRLANVGTIDLAELANEPWVMFPREGDPPIYDRIMALCERSGFTPKVVLETGRMLARLGIVAGGIGVNLVHSAWRNMPYPGVAYVSVEPTDDVVVSCFWRRGDNNSLLRNLVEIVRMHAV
ncbi:LysR family transcriptional regulator [Devosia sp. 2618]|uniref:LysR substrate-binding domain-containing protein n=1 Tax=Devosia sp. 2618 TaxID=3156454 RepID=UPI00339644A8